MKRRQFLASFLLSLLLAGQISLPAFAAVESTDSPTPTATATPEATATPQDTSSPSVSPEPTDSPVVTNTPSPTDSATPSSSPAVKTGVSPDQTGPSTSPGPDKPTGVIPDWVFNTQTGKWEQADKDSFAWDKTSGYWLSPKYFYDTRIGWYEIIPASQPLPSYMITSPQQIVHTPLGDMVVGSKDYQLAKALGILDGTGSSAVANNGAGPSSSSASGSAGGQGWLDLTNLVSVINTIRSNATSGSTNVTGNTNGGDAISGAATVIANLLNLISSAWSWSNGSLNFLVQNIFGDHTGDIHLQPTQTSTGGGGSLGSSASNTNTGPGSTNNAGVNNDKSLTVNSQNSGSINNNVNVAATSGNANVSGNTNGGNATTGNATAEVNIINMINSLINSGNSFFAMLNIFGNLNGDILFPNGFLNGVLANGTSASGASNTTTGPSSTNNAAVNNGGTTTVNAANNQAFNNNIDAQAASGNANLSGNTSAGSATTGSATTNQSVYNLSNTNVFGDNAVLVIVNVLGHWVGKIMRLPGGNQSSSALLTGNATTTSNASNATTGPNSTNNATVNNGRDTSLTSSNSGTITNNVHATANSGDANVTDNTVAGNATTGNAKVATNVANIFNSSLNIKHWFGVLVINVFGNWFGSVNDNTSAGDSPATAQSSPAPTGNPVVLAAALSSLSNPQERTLSPQNDNSSPIQSTGNDNNSTPGQTAAMATPLVLASSNKASDHVAAAAATQNLGWLFQLSAAILLVAAALSGLERKFKKQDR